MINNIEIAGLHLVWRNCFALTAPYAAVNSQQRFNVFPTARIDSTFQSCMFF